MVCLTGDIHQMSLNSSDQDYLDVTEVEAAAEYVSIAKELGVKVTLFATGKSVEEENRDFLEIMQHPNVEFGGHTYYAFKPKWLYNGLFSRLMGLSNGPRTYQNWEIRKTVNVFAEELGVQIVSWRNHAYRHDRNTYRLLSQNGLRFVSDEVGPDRLIPYERNGLLFVPLNVMPDHDHIYHANLTPETTQNWSLARDKFPPKLYPIEQWLEMVKDQITHIIKNRGVATILAHPACMKIADGFEIFAKLCEFISHHKSVFMKELEGEWQ